MDSGALTRQSSTQRNKRNRRRGTTAGFQGGILAALNVNTPNERQEAPIKKAPPAESDWSDAGGESTPQRRPAVKSSTVARPPPSIVYLQTEDEHTNDEDEMGEITDEEVHSVASSIEDSPDWNAKTPVDKSPYYSSVSSRKEDCEESIGSSVESEPAETVDEQEESLECDADDEDDDVYCPNDASSSEEEFDSEEEEAAASDDDDMTASVEEDSEDSLAEEEPVEEENDDLWDKLVREENKPQKNSTTAKETPSMAFRSVQDQGGNSNSEDDTDCEADSDIEIEAVVVHEGEGDDGESVVVAQVLDDDDSVESQESVQEDMELPSEEYDEDEVQMEVTGGSKKSIKSGTPTMDKLEADDSTEPVDNAFDGSDMQPCDSKYAFSKAGTSVNSTPNSDAVAVPHAVRVVEPGKAGTPEETWGAVRQSDEAESIDSSAIQSRSAHPTLSNTESKAISLGKQVCEINPSRSPVPIPSIFVATEDSPGDFSAVTAPSLQSKEIGTPNRSLKQVPLVRASPPRSPLPLPGRSLSTSEDKANATKDLRPSKTNSRRVQGNVKKGKWSLGTKIGMGSFGVVHVGLNARTGNLMAVKSVQIDKAIMRDIRREVDLLKSLDHLHIVKYYGTEMDGKTLHIFQEWVAGGSVTGMLKKFGPFALPVIRSYLKQMLSGLSFLHGQGVLHRDIKGSNILISDEGIVKLADFGASKRLAHKQQDMLQSMTIRGTPYFMAPEVFEEKYGMKADIWSVGCVAFQMYSGQAPWREQGITSHVLLFQHIQRTSGPPPLPPQAEGVKHLDAAAFESFLNKCFKRDPLLRPKACELQSDTFFSESLYSSEGESYRSMFSPGADSIFSTEHMMSPLTKPPASAKHSRRRSIGKSVAGLSSPPVPRRIETPMENGSSPLQVVSPNYDTSEWPSWARKELDSRLSSREHPKQHQEGKSPKSEADQESSKLIFSPNKPLELNPNRFPESPGKISDMMGSLALSDDSGFSALRNPFPSLAASSLSSLNGLKYLDESN